MRVSLRRRRLRAAGIGAVTAAMVATAIGVPATPAAAAVRCEVNYTVRASWSGGFTADVVINNLGDPVSNWTLEWDFPGSQRVVQMWNASYTQNGNRVTARNADWNGNLGTGGSVAFGFNGSYTESELPPPPTEFLLNGTPCRGDNLPPEVSITSPAGGTDFVAPATIAIRATASDPDGSITRVAFYHDGILISEDTTSPYEAVWSGVPVGTYTLNAVAYDDQGASTTSQGVRINVIESTAPRILVQPTAVSVPEGSYETVEVRLSEAPADITAVTVSHSGDPDLSATPTTLTFSSGNWSVAQRLRINAADDDDAVNGEATFTLSASGYEPAVVTASESDDEVAPSERRFLELYDAIHNSGYFSPEGVPYHSIETLMVEAPDHGHETTSEAFSYWLWLEAAYGRITGDWEPFNTAWETMETYIIPAQRDQPTNSFYNPSSPATYAPEYPTPEQYPSALDSNVPVGQDPIANELRQTYGTADIYGMHWLLDVDNVYGFGRCGDGTSRVVYINTYQRGPQESVFETIPHPSCETFTYGGPNGFLPLFVQDQQYARQWRYTNAPDADARAVQAAYWAYTWASEQGNASQISDAVANAARMGDYLRYAMFDKYFKRIGNCTNPTSCPGGTGRESMHYLLSWYYAWGGALDSSAGWAWRIGSSHSHFGYQNPFAAWVLSTQSAFIPRSPTAQQDWETSLNRQVEFYQWLQSAEGAIAGGATNSWGGAYGTPPAEVQNSTFYGMFYDWQPVYHDPPSNNWFGFQAWSMDRMAQLLYVQPDNTRVRQVMDRWVDWVLSEVTVGTNGDYQIPSTLNWSGQPNQWNPSNPQPNTNLHVTVVNYTQDVGITGALARTLLYYAAATGDTEARQTAEDLLDALWYHRDDQGLSVPEPRDAYDRLTQEIYVPAGFSGTMPNGDRIEPGATFDSIRSFYHDDPDWDRVQAAVQAGEYPVFHYHRFWAQVDAALAYATHAELFT